MCEVPSGGLSATWLELGAEFFSRLGRTIFEVIKGAPVENNCTRAEQMLETCLNLAAKRSVLGKTKNFKVPQVILANCPQLTAILDHATWYFLIYAVFMKPSCTSTKSDHSRSCTSTENNYAPDNRRDWTVQFPLCGEDAAVGKPFMSGNETQMSLTLWSEICDVFKDLVCEMCPFTAHRWCHVCM